MNKSASITTGGTFRFGLLLLAMPLLLWLFLLVFFRMLIFFWCRCVNVFRTGNMNSA